jgi:hypothetical protein
MSVLSGFQAIVLNLSTQISVKTFIDAEPRNERLPIMFSDSRVRTATSGAAGVAVRLTPQALPVAREPLSC